MTSPYYADDQLTLWHGDAIEVLRTLPAESVNCAVTSPPYYGLRDYGEPGQYGLEATPAEYVEQMRQVFAEVRRVLATDGTLWLNLGDSYATRWASQRRSGRAGFADGERARTGANATGLPEKSLLGIPWRVAFALQGDGWVLRSDVIWAKPNGLPESVNDRPSNTHEHVFLFTRSPRYWFDLDPIREPHQQQSVARSGRRRFAIDQSQQGVGSPNTVSPNDACHPAGRNPGNVWTIPTRPFPAAHFAVMPPAIAERCILAGCRPGGTVLDPFAGSGTTGMVALKHGRRFVGIDLSAKYLDLSLRTRLAQGALIEPADGAA